MPRRADAAGGDHVDRSEYLSIAIPLDSPLSVDEKALLDEIGGKKNGYFFEADGQALRFSVHSLDLAAFEEEVRGLLRGRDGPGCDLSRMHRVFQELFDRVGSIGSYGIRGGKRIYATYNRERKVRGRKERVRKRRPWYYAADNGFSPENRDLLEEFRNRIIAGDSVSVLQGLPRSASTSSSRRRRTTSGSGMTRPRTASTGSGTSPSSSRSSTSASASSSTGGGSSSTSSRSSPTTSRATTSSRSTSWTGT